MVRAGARRLLQRLDGRSALRHRHRPGVEAHAELRRIGERHDQRASASLAHTIATNTSPKTRPRRCAERSPRINIARPDRLSAGTPDLRVGQLRIRAHRAAAVRQGPRRRRRTTSLDRFDIVPAVRFPFNKLAFLTFNTTAQFRNTFWSRQPARRHRRTGRRCRDGCERRSLAPFRRDERRHERPDARAESGTRRRARTPALPSLDRAVRAGALPHGDRQLQRDPEDREHRQHRRKRDVVHLRPQHAVLRQAHRRRPARDSARGHQRHDSADLQHRRALGSARRRAAVAQHRPDVALHAGAGARCARRRSMASTGTFRTDYDGRYSRFRSFSADAGMGAGTRLAPGELEQRALPSGQPRQEHRAARRNTSTRTRACGFSRTATASRTSSTGT